MYQIYSKVLRFGNFATAAGKKLNMAAITSLGIDISPENKASSELACAEAVNAVVFKAFGDYAGGGLSTFQMYHTIRNNRKFIRVSKPLPGDIILSPTGMGNGKIVGHVGIVSFGNAILANDSDTGIFKSTYTIESWHLRYVAKGAFPVFYYRRLSF